jgi:hypothetical protein
VNIANDSFVLLGTRSFTRERRILYHLPGFGYGFLPQAKTGINPVIAKAFYDYDVNNTVTLIQIICTTVS